MKHKIAALLVGVALAGSAFATNTSFAGTVIQCDPSVTGNAAYPNAVCDAFGNQQFIEGTLNSYNITAPTVVKATPGRVFKVSVIVAGSTVGTLNDAKTTGGASASNEIMAIPNTVGTYDVNWPSTTGIVVVPGTGQTVAVSYY